MHRKENVYMSDPANSFVAKLSFVEPGNECLFFETALFDSLYMSIWTWVATPKWRLQESVDFKSFIKTNPEKEKLCYRICAKRSMTLI